MAGAGAKPFVDRKLAQRRVMLFSKTYVPSCNEVKEVLAGFSMTPYVYEVTEIEKRQDVTQIENYFQIICLSDNREVPRLFLDQKYIGGHTELMRMHNNGQLKALFHGAGVLPA